MTKESARVLSLSPKRLKMLNLIESIGDGVISPEAFFIAVAEEGDSLDYISHTVLYINDELDITGQPKRIGYIKKKNELYMTGIGDPIIGSGTNGGYTLVLDGDKREDVHVRYSKQKPKK